MQDKEKLVRRIIGSVMYLAQVRRYHIFYSVNKPARAMSNPSEPHIGEAKHLRYLAISIDFNITCKKGGFKLTALSEANWGNNPDNGKSTSSCVTIVRNGTANFKVGMQGLTAQSTMASEIVAATLAMKETVYCASMMGGLEFEETFKCVRIHIDNTSALHVPGNKTYSSFAKHVALKLYVREIIQEGKARIHFNHRHRYLVELIHHYKT